MKKIILTNEELGSVFLALAHLIHAGIGPGDALTLLAADEKDPACRELLRTMAAQADAGSSLAEALRSSGCAPEYACTLLDVGQRVGKLEATLEALSRYYRGRADLERQLRAAVQYPAVLLAVLLAVMIVLLVWVLPVFDRVYAQLGSHLTGVAGGLLTLGQVMKHCLPVAAVLLAVIGCSAAIGSVRRACIAFWRRHWGDRGVFGQINTARFIQALSLCVSSGMTDHEAVLLAASLADTPAFSKRCGVCLEQVASGRKLSEALREAKLLPAADCRLLEAGERSGRSEAVLSEIARQQLARSEDALQQEAGKVEPAMVAVACVLIGLVLLSVMLPLVDIMSSIG